MKYKKGDKVMYRFFLGSPVPNILQGTVKDVISATNEYAVEYFVKSSNKLVYSYFKEYELELDNTGPKKRFQDSPYS